MLQLIEKPNHDIAWNKSPSKLSFLRKGLYNIYGSEASLILVFNKGFPPLNGDYLVLKWSANILTFLFNSGGGGNNPLVLLPYDTATSWGLYIDNLAKQFNGHPLLQDSFIATSTYSDASIGVIEIKAKNKGVYYSIHTHTGTTVTLTGATIDIPGVDEEMLSNYKMLLKPSITTNILLEPIIEEGRTLQSIGMLDANNDAIRLDFYDLKDLAGDRLETSLPNVVFLPFISHKSIASCDITIHEYYDLGHKRSLSSKSEQIDGFNTLKVIDGGVALADFSNDTTGAYTANLPLKFLTHQEREKVIFQDQPEWLSAYLIPGDYQIVYKLFYSDGTTAFKTGSISIPFFSQIVTFPVGYCQTDIAGLDSSKTIVYYEFYLEAESGRYTETFTYILDTRFERFKKYFLAKNSLGGWDTFLCIGASKFTGKYNRETIRTATLQENRFDRGCMQMVLNEEEQTILFRSGWMESPAELSFFRQLLLSTEVVELLPLVGTLGDIAYQQNFRAMLMLQDSVDWYDENDSRWAVEFKMSYATKDISYSDYLTKVKEVYYDSFLEFTIQIGEFTSGDSIFISNESAAIEITVNGNVVNTSANTSFGFVLDAPKKTFHFIIKGQDLTKIIIAPTGSTAGTLNISRIASATLQELYLISFDDYENAYLISRLPSLYLLTNLWAIGGNGTFPVDDYLRAALALVKGGSFSLIDLNLASAASLSSFGILYKSVLISEGIAVTT